MFRKLRSLKIQNIKVQINYINQQNIPVKANPTSSILVQKILSVKRRGKIQLVRMQVNLRKVETESEVENLLNQENLRSINIICLIGMSNLHIAQSQLLNTPKNNNRKKVIKK